MLVTPDTRETRQAIIDACLEMNATGLNQGTSGNISVRSDEAILITPSSMPYKLMRTDDIMPIQLDGGYAHDRYKTRPSSEWRFHTAIYADRDDVGAIVHTHSLYATTLSMLRWDIPACHYMIAVFGGATIRCAEYAIFGSPELSVNAVKALKNRTGCLLASHGMVVCGKDLQQAMWRARELETLANQYYLAIQVGKPVILSDEHIQAVADRIKSGYGVWDQQVLESASAN